MKERLLNFEQLHDADLPPTRMRIRDRSPANLAGQHKIKVMFFCLLVAAAASHDIVLSRDPRGNGEQKHMDVIRCHSHSSAHHSSLESMIGDFVLPDTMWCIEPQSGSNCSDRTSRTVYKLVDITCRNGYRDCTVSIDCYDLVLERFWIGLILTLVMIASMVLVVRYASLHVRLRDEERRKRLQ